MNINDDLAFSEDDLTQLAKDMGVMREYLDKQVRRMDGIVDQVEAGWQGRTGKAYRALHRGAAEDAVRIRGILAVLEQAIRMSRDGFTEDELEKLRSFSRVQSAVDVAAEAEKLQAEGLRAGSAAPPSSIADIWTGGPDG
ncbi:WXG100 family type VII secretion target [Streptomyces sp. ITFR-6]|uniref:WXG100 family type VII secretion target n=1 Tax=Streptomyces sp. ITFR-6 TaxID=3075197 RepID=UPI00288BE912|nr:WXG100 family type VII secretion target [Streptomyces sp. ITFR-6]WNI29964.1 WXG100 family type VII secretion target [Streptomyces sp. ITFR-6]